MEIDPRQTAFWNSVCIAARQRLQPPQPAAPRNDGLRELAALAAELTREQRALRGAPAVSRPVLGQTQERW